MPLQYFCTREHLVRCLPCRAAAVLTMALQPVLLQAGTPPDLYALRSRPSAADPAKVLLASVTARRRKKPGVAGRSTVLHCIFI